MPGRDATKTEVQSDMSAVAGVILKVPTRNEAGDPDGNVETVVFATVRRCPGLAKALKRLTKCEIEDAKRTKLLEVAYKQLQDAKTVEEVESAAAATDTAAQASETATQAYLDAAYDFIIEGLKGTNAYTADECERIAALIEPDRYAEIKARAQLGSGVLDFTRAPKGA